MGVDPLHEDDSQIGPSATREIDREDGHGTKLDLAVGTGQVGWRENAGWDILEKSASEQGKLCSRLWTTIPSGEAEPEERDNNAQIEDTYGRGEALFEDWIRQDQAASDQDAPYPYVKAAQDEAQAR